MLLFCKKLHKVTLVKNGWPLKVNGEDHKKQDLYFEMLLFSEKGYKVTLMPFRVKSDHRDKQERTHYVLCFYIITFHGTTNQNCYISVIYILHTDTVKQTISWNNKSDHCDRKTKTLALPYREPHQRTPGCCLNSCKWLTLAFVCAVQLVILWTYSHDSQIHFACALQMFARPVSASHKLATFSFLDL